MLARGAAWAFMPVIALLLVSLQEVAALSTYASLIPNGDGVSRNGVPWPGVGHNSSAGGGARNPFGVAFARANHTWTAELCRADSDGDGFSNGGELGDPECSWKVGATPSRITGISHPGFADSIPSTPPNPGGNGGSNSTTGSGSGSNSSADTGGNGDGRSPTPSPPTQPSTNPQTKCSAPSSNKTFTEIAGIIISDYDGVGGRTSYNPSQNCQWAIECGAKYVAVILAIQLNTSDGGDVLQVTNALGEQVYNKHGVDSSTHTVPSSRVTVRFSSDSSGTGSGFTLNYTCVAQGDRPQGSPSPPPWQQYHHTETATLVLRNGGGRGDDAEPTMQPTHASTDRPHEPVSGPAAAPTNDRNGTATTQPAHELTERPRETTTSTHEASATQATRSGQPPSASDSPHRTESPAGAVTGTTAVPRDEASKVSTTERSPTHVATPQPASTQPSQTQAPHKQSPPPPPVAVPTCSAPSNGSTFSEANGTIHSDADGSETSATYRANERCTWLVNCPGKASSIEFDFTTKLRSDADHVTVSDVRGVVLFRVSGDEKHVAKVAVGARARVSFASGASTGEGAGGFTAVYRCLLPSAAAVTAARNTLSSQATGSSAAAIARASSELLTTGNAADRQVVIEALNRATALSLSTDVKREVVSLVATTVKDSVSDSACTDACRADVKLKTLQIVEKIAVAPSQAGGAKLDESEARGLMDALTALPADASTDRSVERVAVALCTSSNISERKTIVTEKYAIGTARLPPSAVGVVAETVVAGTSDVALPTSARLQVAAGASIAPALTVVEFVNNSHGIAGLQGEGAKIESAVVSVELTDASGAKIAVTDLETPIKIGININDEAAQRIAGNKATAVCSFLASNGQWSTDGVTADGMPAGSRKVTCNTKHLSTFAVSLRAAASAGDTSSNLSGGDSGGLLSTNSGMAFLFLGAIIAVIGIAAVLYFTNKKKSEAQQRRGMKHEMHGESDGGSPMEALHVPMMSAQQKVSGQYNPLLNNSQAV